jgi:hypothetical protein
MPASNRLVSLFSLYLSRVPVLLGPSARNEAYSAPERKWQDGKTAKREGGG